MRRALFLFLYFSIYNTFSQNLIPNGQLESFQDCPSGLRQLHKINDWFSASAGTPEYYNTCGFPANVNPKQGNGLIGLILYSDYYIDIEYVGVMLKDTLERGQTYLLEFYVYVDENAPFSIDKIGAFFSSSKVKLAHWSPIVEKPQVFAKQIIEPSRWVKFEEFFVANGGEQFMTVGNFFEKDEVKIKRNSHKHTAGWYSYFYFDDFSLKKVRTDELKSNSKSDSKSSFTNSFQKKHIVYFESDEFDLSLDELNRLKNFVVQIPENDKIQFELTGFTDSDASKAYNLELSKNRVESVSKIVKEQFSWNLIKLWKGEESPLNENKNEFDKSQNRRVEISIFP
ncbi:MAG: OmpA family protein [Bacteroidetes bacterium]|nr:MAG: OmpA family protein [Bacteroidota bacterium]MBL1145563.1 OmpA family protein [Bacteroidota bacterium]NOG58359.1 OmpA family protein [Bacteroidota bacterium]